MVFSAAPGGLLRYKNGRVAVGSKIPQIAKTHANVFVLYYLPRLSKLPEGKCDEIRQILIEAQLFIMGIRGVARKE